MLHRSNSVVAVRRWLRHCTAGPRRLRYPVNMLLSGLRCSEASILPNTRRINPVRDKPPIDNVPYNGSFYSGNSSSKRTSGSHATRQRAVKSTATPTKASSSSIWEDLQISPLKAFFVFLLASSFAAALLDSSTYNSDKSSYDNPSNGGSAGYQRDGGGVDRRQLEDHFDRMGIEYQDERIDGLKHQLEDEWDRLE